MTEKSSLRQSLLAADFARLGEEIAAIHGSRRYWIQGDMMDGHLAPNIGYGTSSR